MPSTPLLPSSLSSPPTTCLRCTDPWTNSFWKGGLSEAELRATARQVEEEAWSAQKEAGIQRIALDGTWYDSVLDMIFALGLIPKRFRVSLACTA